jgi:hypothetical protein
MAHANGKATFAAWVDSHDWKFRAASHDVALALGRYITSRTAAQAVKDAILMSTATSHKTKRVCLPAKAAIPLHVSSVLPPGSDFPAVTVTLVEDPFIKAPSTPAEERREWELAMMASMKKRAEIIEDMQAKNLELSRALEASLSPSLSKRIGSALPVGADAGTFASGAADDSGAFGAGGAGASGSGGLRTEATYEELDALRGVQKDAEKSAGKSQARSIGLLNHDLEDQQKEYQHYQYPNLPVHDTSNMSAPKVPTLDPATFAKTHFNKGNHASHSHPLPGGRNVQPKQLNFGARSAPIPQSASVSPSLNPPTLGPHVPVIERPSTGHYPDLALMIDYIEQAFDRREAANNKAASEALAIAATPNGPVYLSGSTFPSPYSNQGLITPRTGPELSPSMGARSTGTARTSLPDFIVGGYKVKSQEYGIASDDNYFTTQKYIIDIKNSWLLR